MGDRSALGGTAGIVPSTPRLRMGKLRPQGLFSDRQQSQSLFPSPARWCGSRDQAKFLLAVPSDTPSHCFVSVVHCVKLTQPWVSGTHTCHLLQWQEKKLAGTFLPAWAGERQTGCRVGERQAGCRVEDCASLWGRRKVPRTFSIHPSPHNVTSTPCFVLRHGTGTRNKSKGKKPKTQVLSTPRPYCPLHTVGSNSTCGEPEA